MLANSLVPLFFPCAVLLPPIGATLWFRWAALRVDQAKQTAVRASYRKYTRVILSVIVAIWWVHMGPGGPV
jgi:hypothetical protein